MQQNQLTIMHPFQVRVLNRCLPWYVLPALATVLIFYLSDLPPFNKLAFHFAWLLTPYRSLPCIFDSPDFIHEESVGDSPFSFFGMSSLICLSMILLALLAMLLH